MTTSLGQTVFQNALTPVRLASVYNVSGTYNNGPANNGVGATLTVAASSLSVDSVAVAVGDRVLLANQTNAYENGVYVVYSIGSTVVLQRAADQQCREQLKEGQFVNVGAGTAQAGASFSLSAPLPDNLGVDSVVWNLVMGGQRFVSVPVTAAEIIAMYTTPKLLVPAPGANNILILDKCELVLTYGGTAFASGGVSHIQWDDTTAGAGVIASSTLTAANLQATASTVLVYNGGIVPAPFATCVNQGLYLSNVTGVFATGNSTCVANVRYHVVKVA